VTPNPLTFIVFGQAVPAGSKRHFVTKTGKVNTVDASGASLAAWKADLRHAAQEVMEPHELLGRDVPLDLQLRFFIRRPKGHFGTGRNGDKLRASAPAYPVTKPDTTKLLRAVEDALTGIVWADDAQIVTQTVWKRYVIAPGIAPFVEVKVWWR
jgi:Holliday junction resolvase RusA-like endonuclease